MKNTIGILRKKVKGMFPYIVVLEDGKTKYLFEVTRKTSLSNIMKIERKFSDDELVFATIDMDFSEQWSTIDAANLYEVNERKMRPFFFYKFYYNQNRFLKTKLVMQEDKRRTLVFTSDEIHFSSPRF